MFLATPSIPIPPPGSASTPVALKNYSYTYAWYYLPPAPVRLP